MGTDRAIDEGRGVVTEAEVTGPVTGPVTTPGGAELARADGLNLVREFVRVSKAASTVRGYQSDWKHFTAWCGAHQVSQLPAAPEDVAAYIAECSAWLTAGSIQRRLNAIAEAHKATGRESPTSAGIVRNTFKGIRRSLGTAPTNQKSAAITEDVRAMVAQADAGIMGFRDRALMLVGFAGAFRRSELVGLDMDDLEFGNDGLTIMLRRSKTDQEGVGRKIGILAGTRPETCPVRALRAWLLQSGVKGGPVFRSLGRHGIVKSRRLPSREVATTVKKLAKRIGLDPAKYARHSLRSGHATSAAIGGASERQIMNQTGHTSVEMVRRYIRDTNIFRGNSSGSLDL
jgi:site-specific recombinase XerD